MIPIIVDLLSGAFMSWGGYNFLLARRLFMPLTLCLYCLFFTHDLWSLTMMSAYGALTLGYGDNAPLRHIFGPCWGRGVWGILVGLCLCLWAILTGHLALWIGLAYLTACFFAEPLFKNMWQIVGDIIIGVVFGSIVFLIK